MSEVARNFNKAFDAGREAHRAGAAENENPYRAEYAKTAWRAGFRKAFRDSLQIDQERAS